MTTATMTTQKLCQSKKNVNSEECSDREPHPVLTFGKAVSSFKVVKRYLCPYKISDASFRRPEHLDTELLFIHHT
jgi:Centromere protein B dimerisation domain.